MLAYSYKCWTTSAGVTKKLEKRETKKQRGPYSCYCPGCSCTVQHEEEKPEHETYDEECGSSTPASGETCYTWPEPQEGEEEHHNNGAHKNRRQPEEER